MSTLFKFPSWLVPPYFARSCADISILNRDIETKYKHKTRQTLEIPLRSLVNVNDHQSTIFSLFPPFLLPHVFQSFITQGTATERKKKPYTHNLLHRTLFLAETETFVWPPQRANEEEFQPTLTITTTIFLPNGSESKKKKSKKGTESISPYQVFHGSKSLRQRLTARFSMSSSLTFSFVRIARVRVAAPAPFGHI